MTPTPGNPAPGGNPGQKRTRIDDIFKNFDMKTILKLKNKPISENFKLRMNLSAGLPNLVRLSL
jgi:hypothetical protein